MDKNAIKKYAVWARRELIERVSQKALQYGITADGKADPNADSVNGRLLTDAEKKQRRELIRKVNAHGYEQVMEEIAYTWFNRFAALRFMEVNGYLPSHVRVFTNDEGEFKPQILAEAIHLDLDGLNMDRVYELKNANKDEELFKYLLVIQCNALSSILPKMFQRIADDTELLLPDYLLRDGSTIHQMIALIPEEDWRDQVQIIGWLYQYYNTEPKDKVFADLKKNIKITKENIPAATQLFTPDWIVRYMVENSLGRLWLEGHPNDTLKAEWRYYLDEAEQEAEVQAQLAEIRKEYAALKPEDIRCIDPCMGSGHILCYLFDVLVQIYEDYGYTAREAVSSIVEKNLWGLDIDDRAAQLAYFAVMMKARQYDRRFFAHPVQPNVYAIQESNWIGGAFPFDMGDFRLSKEHQKTLNYLIDAFHDAKEYGSILQLEQCDYAGFIEAWELTASQTAEKIGLLLWYDAIKDAIPELAKIAVALTQKYQVVCTNPPYMGNMPVKMTALVQQQYAEAKYDLYAVFIKKALVLTKKNGFMALITQHSWMFISSFEIFRRGLMSKDYVSLLHLGTRAFEEIGGEVVQTVSMVLRNSHIENNIVVANRLVDYPDAESKEQAYLNHESIHKVRQRNFELLPGNPIVYWLSNEYFEAFKKTSYIEQLVERKAGVVTGNDNYFLRFWFEPVFGEISFQRRPVGSYGKYHIMSKGGSARRFYGNFEYVIRLRDLYDPSKTNVSVRRGDQDYYFKKAIGWSQVGNAQKTFRAVENSVCGTATPTIYFKNDKFFNYVLGFLNTKIAYEYLTAYNPTINLLTTDICNLPLYILDSNLDNVTEIVNSCISGSKEDWDSFETSWDFTRHPLVRDAATIAEAFAAWEAECDARFTQLKANEEELNRIFIDIYGLQDELTPEVEDKDVTVRKADLGRDIRSLISYAVGCMFGRYSLDAEGLAYAGGEWDASKYTAFQPDKDAILPICDDDYFEDDIMGRFVQWVETVYGKATLEENLKFIADALGGKGSPREVIRKYFLGDFYADHCKIYQKRPIYWLFDSGKKNGFKCLIYLHRYQPDTIARIRTDYVYEQQARYRTAIADLEQRMGGASASERVKLSKRLAALQAQATETREYEEKIHHLADQMIKIDLDDGVKKNYAIFQDVLAKIK